MINEERMKIVEIEYKRAIRMGQYQTVRMLNDNVYNEYFKERTESAIISNNQVE